jgi:Type II intron maturase
MISNRIRREQEVNQADDEQRRRAERARRTALFRYELIQDVIDPQLSVRERGRLVRDLAGRDHEGPSGGLSPAKTLITHGRTQAARFLGYQVVVLHADDKRDRRGHRSINAVIGLKVPADVIRAKIKPYTHCGKPIRRTERIADTDFSIVAQFQAEFRGVAEYYRLAFNRHRLSKLKYVMERSLVKTLARKYRVTSGQVYRRYRAVLATEHGLRRGLRVIVPRDGKKPLVAQWGGISLARDATPAPLNDDPPRIWSGRSELIQRLLASRCDMCQTTGQVEVHHIRALKDLVPKGKRAQPAWAKRMAARRRKTLVVCRACHEGIHAGRPARQPR